jgi:hypothetical protein
VVVIPVCCQTRTRNLDRLDHLEKPLTPLLRELDFPDLLSDIDDERIWHANFHLVLDKSAIGEGLDHVIGIDPAERRRPAGVLQLDGHGAVRGSYEAVWFAGDAQSVRAQGFAEEGLAGQILVEHLAGGNPGLPALSSREYKQDKGKDGQSCGHHLDIHRAHPIQTKRKRMTASARAMKAAHRKLSLRASCRPCAACHALPSTCSCCASDDDSAPRTYLSSQAFAQ